MMESGSIHKSMEGEQISLLMVIDTLVSIRMEGLMEMEHMYGAMEVNMKDSF